MTNFIDDRHAQYCGWVTGIALRHGLHVEIVNDEGGNHTDRLLINVGAPMGKTVMIEFIIPEPPDEWEYPQ